MIEYKSPIMVRFQGTNSGGILGERMHCIPLGDGTFQVDNSPFHAFGVSLGDKITATEDSDGLIFDSIISRGGHSTYRVRLPSGASHQHFLEHWAAMEELGCSYEGSSLDNRRLYAIDIPPGVDVASIYRLLEDGEANGAWEFEEAHFAGNPPDQ